MKNKGMIISLLMIAGGIGGLVNTALKPNFYKVNEAGLDRLKRSEKTGDVFLFNSLGGYTDYVPAFVYHLSKHKIIETDYCVSACIEIILGLQKKGTEIRPPSEGSKLGVHCEYRIFGGRDCEKVAKLLARFSSYDEQYFLGILKGTSRRKLHWFDPMEFKRIFNFK